VEASDIRAGAALVLAGLAADGETIVYEAGHIDRGYDRFDHALRTLGADVRRFDTSTKSQTDLQSETGMPS
jgi:UDP-N-acetylglucosamine 1-carboxyvinyltransferase